MKPEIFSDRSEFFDKAAHSTAKRQNCSVDLVYSCMRGLDGIFNQPEHVEAVTEITHHFNDAAKFARKLHRALTLMTPNQRKELEVAGCVTTFQIEHLADVLGQDVDSLREWSRKIIRTGGRNPAAHDIAELMRRIFRRQRRKITYGTAGDSDSPSTDFGKAVLDAMGDFGIKAGWRRPALQAFDKQLAIQDRMRRICEARRLRDASSL